MCCVLGFKEHIVNLARWHGYLHLLILAMTVVNLFLQRGYQVNQVTIRMSGYQVLQVL